MLVLPRCGAERMLDAFLLTDKILRLFKNNVTPDESFVAANLTEADFDGYAPQPLFGGSWSIVQGTPTLASYAMQSFVSASSQAPQNIYGYCVVESGSGVLCWAERFGNGPYIIANEADEIEVTPKITQETKS